MSLVELGSVARFVNGAAFKPSDWGSVGLPIIRIQNLTGTSQKLNYTTRTVKPELLVETGDLLVSWSATLDVYRWSGPQGVLNQHIFKVIPKQGVDPDYLYYALKSAISELESKTHGSTMKHVVRGDFEGTRIRLPTSLEQGRIADSLSRADGILKLSREAERKAAAILPALFLDMFGDPSANPKCWPMRRIRDFVARFEGGKNLLAASEGSTDFRILKVSAVTRGTYIESESKPTPERYEPPESHVVRVGDMLFSRANTAELVGATAVVEETDGRSLLPDKLWRFVWSEPVEQRYMHALFQNKHVRSELGRMSSGTSASMRNISQGKLFEMRLPIAPLEQQATFARHAEAVQSVWAQQAAATQKAEAAFHALLARAFAGEIGSASSREREATVA